MTNTLCLIFASLLSLWPHTPDDWQLTWEENFDKPALGPEWERLPRGTADWNNYMSACDSCYDLRDGLLVLRGLRDDFAPNDTAPYLTGGVRTTALRPFTGGRIEVCARLQGARGAWPAIWMLPLNAKWPEGGEIDIMERLNHDGIAYQTVHSYYTYVLKFDNTPPHGGTNTISPDTFNVYAVEIYPDSLSFYINGRHTFSYPRIETGRPGQFPFFQPYYLLIDMQIGGAWVGRVDPEELPVEMHIDWVRYYTRRQ